MKKILFGLILILLPMFMYSIENENEETEEEIRSIVDVWKDVLLYGIDSEVIDTINSIRNAKET